MSDKAGNPAPLHYVVELAMVHRLEAWDLASRGGDVAGVERRLSRAAALDETAATIKWAYKGVGLAAIAVVAGDIESVAKVLVGLHHKFGEVAGCG